MRRFGRQQTLRRVREAINCTGYVPNHLRRPGVSRSGLVADVVPVAAPSFRTWKLTETVRQRGYHVTFGQADMATPARTVARRIIARRGRHRAEDHALATRSPAPAGSRYSETWDLTPTPIDMLVGFSHERIGAAVAEYLHAKGRRRIAVITAADERARRRAGGLSAAADMLGIATTLAAELPMFVAPAPGTLGSGRRGLADLLSRHSGIDAVFCSSDMLALGVVIEAQTRGIPVPDAIAVVGYGDLNFAADTIPPLTTVSVDGPAIGRLAARCIIDRAQGRSVAEPVVDVGFSIVQRASA
jgi:LacI family gluconate utilization system Gnt-I transcriptional repressor